MKRIETSIPGLCLIEPVTHEDERGFFFESYNKNSFAELGITTHFVQDNHSKSVKNTLRGMHYQLAHPQAKLCRVVQGAVLDVVVDIRYGSPYFGSHVTTILSAENKQQIYIPEGFAHGYLVLSETAEFLYKCSDFYCPGDDRGIAWDDPEVAIPWKVSGPILSPKDRLHPLLSRVAPADLPVYAGDDNS
ncbi:MAG TPA: dTDP-4-dehydrorhamnose 3,5-epimerase [Blastocatellia bacterium]|nr:dTDP-4-dehydrorhamnose 3,5-epimerase [Blastocatellia bacterium]